VSSRLSFGQPAVDAATSRHYVDKFLAAARQGIYVSSHDGPERFFAEIEAAEEKERREAAEREAQQGPKPVEPQVMPGKKTLH
jgi:hypothetical protein